MPRRACSQGFSMVLTYLDLVQDLFLKGNTVFFVQNRCEITCFCSRGENRTCSRAHFINITMYVV